MPLGTAVSVNEPPSGTVVAVEVTEAVPLGTGVAVEAPARLPADSATVAETAVVGIIW